MFNRFARIMRRGAGEGYGVKALIGRLDWAGNILRGYVFNVFGQVILQKLPGGEQCLAFLIACILLIASGRNPENAFLSAPVNVEAACKMKKPNPQHKKARARKSRSRFAKSVGDGGLGRPI